MLLGSEPRLLWAPLPSKGPKADIFWGPGENTITDAGFFFDLVFHAFPSATRRINSCGATH